MLTINKQRLLDNLQELGEIGRDEKGGVSRTALSPADVAGRNWFREKIEAAGLQWKQDGAGNLSAILPASDSQTQTILFGSHLDSVPNGGRFDGALGPKSEYVRKYATLEHQLSYSGFLPESRLAKMVYPVEGVRAPGYCQ